MKFFKAVIILSGLAVAATSQAGLYEYKANPRMGGQIGQQVEEIRSTFDSGAQKFTWDVDFTSNSSPVDGFWLVVNNGPNPKQSDTNELAIIYGDLETGIASTYVYNGKNSADSIRNPMILLQTDTFNASSGGFSLDISTALINAWISPSSNYTGIAFDEAIGVWFHPSIGSNFSFNANGDIVDYSYTGQGWIDFSNGTAVQVSSPATLALLGLSLLGMGALRRKS